MKNAITEIGPNGVERRLPGDKYYVPGSILRINLDSTQSATWGMSNKADVYFQNSPVFKLGPDARDLRKSKTACLVHRGESIAKRMGLGGDLS
ncbi:MAG: hypothetical protein WDN75_11075 [Bacteroidota bacterium]